MINKNQNLMSPNDSTSTFFHIQEDFPTASGSNLWIDKEIAIDAFLKSMGLEETFKIWHKGFVIATINAFEAYEE